MFALIATCASGFGVRMAVGATRTNIVRLVLQQAAGWTAAGLAFGMAGSWFASRFLRQLLFNVAEHDPVAYIVATLCLVMVMLGAAILPARRAASVDPVTALRSE